MFKVRISITNGMGFQTKILNSEHERLELAVLIAMFDLAQYFREISKFGK